MDESLNLKPSEIAVISTAPCNFAGAATIHARILCALALRGYVVSYVASDTPFLNSQLVESGVNVSVPAIISTAYPGSDAVSLAGVANHVVRQARMAAKLGRRIVLWGTYIIPHYQAIMCAAELLRKDGIACATIAHPAGSDVWQIGTQALDLLAGLLGVGVTSARVTYSMQFATEIQSIVEKTLPFTVIPPPVDLKAFHPVSRREKAARRRDIDIPDDAFVIVNCSNMRPVKRIDQVIRIAQAASSFSQREVVLLLVGPVTQHLRESLAQVGMTPPDRAPFAIKNRNLSIIALDLQQGVSRYLELADVALNASVHDAFNVSLAESMACGLPIISSNVVGLSELMSPESGWWFRYPKGALDDLRCGERTKISDEQISGIVQYLIALESNLGWASEIGWLNRSIVDKHCSEAKVSSQWVKLLSELHPQ